GSPLSLTCSLPRSLHHRHLPSFPTRRSSDLIPPEERARVFERFSRGSASGPRSGGGTGLGLAIASWATELHGGDITVLDTPSGCRIRVTIPPPRKREPAGAGR